MKVFISWSKPLSHAVAEAFADWLPKVIQECRGPYVSSDTDKGEAWFQAITGELQKSKVGVAFITPQNLNEEWIHLESGAIYAALDKALLPVLVNLKKTEYDGPLRNLQMTELGDKADMLKLMRTINKNCDVPLDGPVLESTFDTFWPALAEATEKAIAEQPIARRIPKRTNDDKIDEILLQLRALNQAIDKPEPPPQTASERQAATVTERRREKERAVVSFEKLFGGRFVKDASGLVIGTVVDAARSGETFAVRIRAMDPEADPRFWSANAAELQFTDEPF